MRDIGKNIKLLRQRQNMTQDELAEALFVTRQTVSNYETGRSRPDVEMLLKVAEVLDVDANTLLYGPEIPQSRKEAYIKTASCLGLTVFFGVGLLLLIAAQRVRIDADFPADAAAVAALACDAGKLPVVGWRDGLHAFTSQS